MVERDFFYRNCVVAEQAIFQQVFSSGSVSVRRRLIRLPAVVAADPRGGWLLVVDLFRSGFFVITGFETPEYRRHVDASVFLDELADLDFQDVGKTQPFLRLCLDQRNRLLIEQHHIDLEVFHLAQIEKPQLPPGCERYRFPVLHAGGLSAE